MKGAVGANFPNSRTASRHWAFWLPLISIFLVELVRLRLVDRFYLNAMMDHGLYSRLALKHDGLIVGLFVLIHIAAWSAAFRPLSIVLRLLAWSLLTVCVVDVYVLAQFTERLWINDFILFGPEGRAILDMASQFVADSRNLPVTSVMVLALLSFLAAWPAAAPLRVRSSILGSLAGMLMIGISRFPDPITYINDFVYLNVAEIQAMSGVLTPYGPGGIEAARRFSEQQDNARRCVPGLNSKRNVILVLMESLSSHQSKYLSGLSDWTPKMDAIARDNHVWTNFYANGNNTADGLVASLTGHDPLTAINGRNYRRWMRVSDAMPFRMRQAGYKSAFLMSGSLKFLGTDDWLSSIGFDYLEDEDAPFYKDSDRNGMVAAPDKDLYDRSLHWVEREAGPYFLVVNTLSTHAPYIDPLTHVRSERSVFEYADAAFKQFVDGLLAQHYFARGGVLLLTGDHHDMVPIGPDEMRRYGVSADARLPLIVIGDGLQLPQHVDGAFQQADIPPSVEYLVGERACFTQRQRNLFQPDKPEPPRCILHMRGDWRDRVDALCGDHSGRIRFDGDATRAMDDTIPNVQPLIQEINAERIGWFLRRQPDGSVARSLPDEARLSWP